MSEIALLTYTGRYRLTFVPYHLIKPERMDMAEWQTVCFGTGRTRYDYRGGNSGHAEPLPLNSQLDCKHDNLGLAMFTMTTRSFKDEGDTYTSTICVTCGRLVRDRATEEDKHSLSVVGSL